MTTSPDFAANGLATETPLAEKLWTASKILNCSPFSPELLDHSVAQLDFIIEMWYRDDPRRGRLVRPGKEPEGIDATRARARWLDVLRGKALDEFTRRLRPSAAVLKRLAGGLPPRRR